MSHRRCFLWLDGEGGGALSHLKGGEQIWYGGEGEMGWGERKVRMPAAAHAVEAKM